MELQQALGDFQAAVFQERKHTLQIVADNDMLRIQELKDRKKIRFLLSLSDQPENEITYFRDRLDKRLVKVAKASARTELDSVGCH
jgi:coiled-coil domain-containing protein 77